MGREGLGALALTFFFVASCAPATAISTLDLAVGFEHACVLREGRAICWGDDRFGQLGRSEASESPRAPAPLLDAREVIDVAAGGSSTCVLDAHGLVRCVGLNRHGQLGDGSTESRATLELVHALPPASAITVGADHACAIADGDAWCWGWNGTGQVGIEGGGDVLTPHRVEGVHDAVVIVAGYLDTCAIERDETLVCWGALHGPPTAWGLARAVAIGVDHVCAIREDETRCLGAEPGGGRPPLETEGRVYGAGGVAGGGAVDHLCVIDRAGALACWGKNEHGQLGNGSQRFAISHEPVPLDAPARAVGVGVAFSCALSGTEVLCWGDDTRGQLGDGGGLPSFSPLALTL